MAIVEYDCAIVGAGFVGATLAIALQKYGLKVLVIDGRSPLVEVGSQDVRGIALSPSSRFIFEDLDLWNELAEHAEPITAINISEMGALPSVELNALDAGLEALAYVIPADHLLRTIENKLLEDVKTSDGQLLWRTSIESYAVADDQLSMTVIDHEQQRAEINVRLLIGADGVNSKVRALANIGSTIRAYNQHAIVATVKIDGIEPNRAYERFTPTGPVALLPMAGGRHVLVRCCLLEESESLLALSDEEFINDVSARFARPVGHLSALGARRSHPLVLSQADTLVSNRVALVGAAAVTVHPNGAQGLNLGLRDAAALCNTIMKHDSDTHQDAELEARKNRIGQADQLTTFAQNRRRDHRRVIRFTDGMARGFVSTIPGARFIRRSGLLVMKLLPMIQRQIIFEGTGQDRFVDLPLTREPIK